MDVFLRTFQPSGTHASQCQPSKIPRNMGKSSDMMRIIELLLITPFTNAKLEYMFSRMNHIKTVWRNKLGTGQMHARVLVKKGRSIEDFNPDRAIQAWQKQVCQISATKPHQYPKKHKTTCSASDCVVDIARYTLSETHKIVIVHRCGKFFCNVFVSKYL